MKYDCGEASKLKARPNSFLSWRAKLPRKQTPLRTAARLPWGRSAASGVCCPMCGTGTFCEGSQTPLQPHNPSMTTPQQSQPHKVSTCHGAHGASPVWGWAWQALQPCSVAAYRPCCPGSQLQPPGAASFPSFHLPVAPCSRCCPTEGRARRTAARGRSPRPLAHKPGRQRCSPGPSATLMQQTTDYEGGGKVFCA